MPVEGTKCGRCLDYFGLRLPHSNATKHHRARAKQKKRHRKEREENLEQTKGGKNKGGRKFETTVRYKNDLERQEI